MTIRTITTHRLSKVVTLYRDLLFWNGPAFVRRAFCLSQQNSLILFHLFA